MIFSLFVISCTTKINNLEEELGKIENLRFKKIKGDTTFNEYYELYFTQKIDHNNPKSKTFEQRVLLGHHNFDKPMVVELQGYEIWTEKAGELSKILKANQLTIEHRFFKNSMPDSLDWSKLNIKQAAADQHIIIQALKKIYKTKWISTGISKGGQTTIFHRYFYPKDVDISVPYVAPLNLKREDPRIHEHLNSVADSDSRNRILAFQKLCFQKKEKLMPFFKEYANQKQYSFLMGYEKAFDLTVLEYSFAFWQWGNYRPDDIPTKDEALNKIFKHLVAVSGPSFFDDKSNKPHWAFFHQALTEIGMYDYDITPFKKYLAYDKNLTFDHVFMGKEKRVFNGENMNKINKWLQTDAYNMLFIYGEYDTWSATSVQLNGNTKCKKFVNPKGSHATRIRNFKEETQTEIISTLESWLKD
ncbi:MAG: peptidase [Marinifilaceae bacterium]|nr:peptidase [Marinifilaceae bacterium]